MKISLNLATPSGARQRYALAWAIPLVIAAAAGLVALSYLGVANFREYHKNQKNLEDVLRQKQELEDRDSALRKDLEQPQERELLRKAQYLNELIEQRQLSVAELTEKVSKLLPSTVRLTSMGLTHSKRENQTQTFMRFVAVGQSEEALANFLNALDDSPDFTDLQVSTQGFQSIAATGGAVSVSCTARFVGGEAR